MKKLFLSTAVIILLSGCSLLNFPSLNAPKAPDTVYKYHDTITTEPRVVQTDAKGNSVVFTAQTRTVDVNYDNKEKPLSWWQKLCNWLAGLGTFAILGLVVMIFIAPVATIAWLKSEADKFKTAFTQTVQGIDKSGVVQTTPALAQALSSTQDASVKAMVDDVQQPGK